MRLNAEVADICRSRTIAAEPQAIWDVLADFGAISSWVDFVDHSCLLDPQPPTASPSAPPVASSSAATPSSSASPSSTRPRTLAYDIEGLPTPAAPVTNRWTLAPSAGGTVVTLTSTRRDRL